MLSALGLPAVDAYMREKFLSGKGLRRPCLRENCGETCSRGLSFCKFCVVCSASLVQVLVSMADVWHDCTFKLCNASVAIHAVPDLPDKSSTANCAALLTILSTGVLSRQTPC